MKLVPIDSLPATPAPADYRPELETGNILFFAKTPFELPDDSKQFLRQLSFGGRAIHKNIAYRPATDRVTGISESSADVARLRGILRDYSHKAAQLASELLPEYARGWTLDYASFRPLEEQGRDLPLNKRNDLIHTDAFPTRPTNGGLILRLFTNIHPLKARVWVTSDPFARVAEKYASDGGLARVARESSSAAGRWRNESARILHSLGLPVAPRSPYDRFMLGFHEYLKRNEDFQANSTKYRFEFPPDSTWLAFTDVVPHSVQSGQYALEQTFIISRESLADPGNAPVSILERLCGRPLATA